MPAIRGANADSNPNRNCNSHADSPYPYRNAYPMHGEMYANPAAAP